MSKCGCGKLLKCKICMSNYQREYRRTRKNKFGKSVLTTNRPDYDYNFSREVERTDSNTTFFNYLCNGYDGSYENYRKFVNLVVWK